MMPLTMTTRMLLRRLAVMARSSSVCRSPDLPSAQQPPGPLLGPADRDAAVGDGALEAARREEGPVGRPRSAAPVMSVGWSSWARA
jgi:hypothetical protein